MCDCLYSTDTILNYFKIYNCTFHHEPHVLIQDGDHMSTLGDRDVTLLSMGFVVKQS